MKMNDKDVKRKEIERAKMERKGREGDKEGEMGRGRKSVEKHLIVGKKRRGEAIKRWNEFIKGM
jgi:hypothetical protein